MTIFHVLKYSGQPLPAEEYPAWVMDQYNSWLNVNYFQPQSPWHQPPAARQVTQRLNEFLLEYDPEAHGSELYKFK